ncbi:MAG: hypothetical protein OXN19_16115 [Caldilineaceae bacterium]|nr:hypothetical protein [Caldilineaceae bacterium]
MKHTSLVVICLLILSLITSCVAIPAKDDPAAYTKSFVQDAIRLYNQDGRQAMLDHYNSHENADGPWFLFVMDENNRLLAHYDPARIGNDGFVAVDSTGYKFGEAICAATEQGQWVTYVRTNYETGQEARKHSWVIRHDGLIFGSGWYEPQ